MLLFACLSLLMAISLRSQNVLSCPSRIFTTFGLHFFLRLLISISITVSIFILSFTFNLISKIYSRTTGEGNWKVNPGDGAFYGPKIDIKVTYVVQYCNVH